MSHMRSASLRELVGLLAAELVGISVHDVTVERRVSYLADWSGVRDEGGGGMLPLEGWSNGVLTVEDKGSASVGAPSMEAGGSLFTGWLADPLEGTKFPSAASNWVSFGRGFDAMVYQFSKCQLNCK